MFQNQINLYRKVSLISYLPAWLEIKDYLIQFDTRPTPFEKPEIHDYVAIASTYQRWLMLYLKTSFY